MPIALATISAHEEFTFRVNPYQITWDYNLRTHVDDTYGGKVIQILGVDLTTMHVQTVAGRGGYEYVDKLVKFFKDMCLWQVESEVPAIFSFPPKKYRLQVWGEKIIFPDSVQNVDMPIQMQFQIEQDLGGHIKKSAMRKELQKLATGVGYVSNEYNQPKEADVIKFQAILDAQGVTPGGEGGGGSFTGDLGGDASLSAGQQSNAQAIIKVALSRNLGRDGAILGIMTAWTESTLNNVNHGDSMGPSSRGLFQQMPQYWGHGTPEERAAQVMDPTASAGLFFDAVEDIANWQVQDPWVVAQAVQQSEFSDGSNYKGNLARAIAIVDNIMKPSTNTPLPGNTVGAKAVNAAAKWIGTTYAWGGGDANGPTQGIRDGGPADAHGDYNKVGFDCSGLALHAWYQASGGTVTLTHSSKVQYNEGTHIAQSALQPGDLVFFAYNTSDPGTIHHVAIFAGNNQMWEAPQSGDVVKLSTLRTSGYIGATRPT